MTGLSSTPIVDPDILRMAGPIIESSAAFAEH